jgi:A/G-specific adenine glycosylase
VPRRELPLLLIVRGDSVLLQRRPEQGIWGGLWCPPACPQVPASPAEARAAAIALLSGAPTPEAGAAATQVAAARALPVFEHALTHFRLVIAPWRVDLPAIGSDARPARGRAAAGEAAAAAAAVPDPPADCRWWPLSACADAALPVPARRLLAALGAQIT